MHSTYESVAYIWRRAYGAPGGPAPVPGPHERGLKVVTMEVHGMRPPPGAARTRVKWRVSDEVHESGACRTLLSAFLDRNEYWVALFRELVAAKAGARAAERAGGSAWLNLFGVIAHGTESDKAVPVSTPLSMVPDGARIVLYPRLVTAGNPPLPHGYRGDDLFPRAVPVSVTAQYHFGVGNGAAPGTRGPVPAPKAFWLPVARGRTVGSAVEAHHGRAEPERYRWALDMRGRRYPAASVPGDLTHDAARDAGAFFPRETFVLSEGGVEPAAMAVRVPFSDEEADAVLDGARRGGDAAALAAALALSPPDSGAFGPPGAGAGEPACGECGGPLGAHAAQSPCGHVGCAGCLAARAAAGKPCGRCGRGVDAVLALRLAGP